MIFAPTGLNLSLEVQITNKHIGCGPAGWQPFFEGDKMNYDEALQCIHSLERFGSRPGLERITRVLRKFKNPQNNLKFIHIAGTNGKGSTAVFSASILQSAGFKTGLFISPFVVDFRERIQINGEFIEKSDLARLTEKVRAVAKGNDYLTEFEFITVLAFLYFGEKNCDVVVLETGLGGRLDATNVIEKPLVSVITRIGLDHTKVLGGTVPLITAEKCGIIKNGAPVVTGASQLPEALAVIEKNCREKQSPLFEVKTPGFSSPSAFETCINIDGNKYNLGLPGAYQAENAALAAAATKIAFPKIGQKDLQKGLKNARFPARFEVISHNPLVILDGAHNPCGAAALTAALKTAGLSRLVAVCGMMADKEVSRVLETVSPFLSSIVCLSVTSNPRSLPGEKLAEKAAVFCPSSAADGWSAALRSAADTLKKENAEGILVFGSLYLAGEIRDKLMKFFN